jgi:hypothetical protein
MSSRRIFSLLQEDEKFNECAMRGVGLSLRPVTDLIDGYSVAAYDSH